MPVSGSKRARKADQEKSRKNHMGAGERWSIGACKAVSIVFNTSFWYSNSWYTLWLVNCDSLLKHLHCTLIIWFCARRVLQTFWAYETLLYCTCDVLKWSQEVGLEVGGLRYLKRCLPALSFSLPATFCSFAISLLAHFFRSSALTKSLAQAICIQSFKQKMLNFYTSLNLEHTVNKVLIIQ